LLIISKIHESCGKIILGGMILAFYIPKLNQPVRLLLSKETVSFEISPDQRLLLFKDEHGPPRRFGFLLARCEGFEIIQARYRLGDPVKPPTMTSI
jgi:hypothetical protein